MYCTYLIHSIILQIAFVLGKVFKVLEDSIDPAEPYHGDTCISSVFKAFKLAHIVNRIIKV